MEGNAINVMGYDVLPVEVEEGLRLHRYAGKTSCVYFGRSLKWKRKSIEPNSHQ